MEASDILNQIVPPLDNILANQLVKEFIDLEKRYVLGDWEPATLDGGQFAEITSRIVYHIDSGNCNRRKGVNSCLKYVEDINNNNQHYFPQRRAALHLGKVINILYKFRSQRGAIHIDPDYSANELDAKFVLAIARWIMSEILRIFWTGSTYEVATVIREIVRYEVPAVLLIDGRSFVLRTDCTVEEEILLLLHKAGERGLYRLEIGKCIPRSSGAISNSLNKLCSNKERQVKKRDNGTFYLTPNGTKRIHEELANKLTIK